MQISAKVYLGRTKELNKIMIIINSTTINSTTGMDARRIFRSAFLRARFNMYVRNALRIRMEDVVQVSLSRDSFWSEWQTGKKNTSFAKLWHTAAVMFIMAFFIWNTASIQRRIKFDAPTERFVDVDLTLPERIVFLDCKNHVQASATTNLTTESNIIELLQAHWAGLENPTMTVSLFFQYYSILHL